MTQRMAMGLMAALAALATVSAADFPLELRTLTVDEALTFPGGYGAYGRLGQAKPTGVQKVPQFVSAHPFYGQLQAPGTTAKGMVFCLDESKGDGKGYDRLRLDLNGNGDLTDDPELAQAPNPGQNTTSSSSMERALFGPAEGPADKVVGLWKPKFIAELYFYNRRLLTSRNDSGTYFGQLRVRAAAYLETTVELNGIKQRLGVADGNSSFALGDDAKVMEYGSGSGAEWYLSPGDFFVRDRNSNGRFDNIPGASEAEIYSSIIYWGGQPCSVSLSADFKTLHLEPYAGATGFMTVSNAERLDDLRLVREVATNQWQGISPQIRAGKIEFPVGSYRLYSCSVTAQATDGSTVRSEGERRRRQGSFKVEAGQTGAMNCGQPLALAVTASKETGTESEGGLMGAARSLFGGGSGAAGATVLQLNVVTSGSGGEAYSRFLKLNSKQEVTQLPPPAFKIFDPAGKEIAAGNFEYG